MAESKKLHEMIARYKKVSTAAVCDILDKMGYPCQTLSANFRPLDNSMSMAGPAYTIKGFNSTLGGSKTSVPDVQMFREFYDGCVIVMETGCHRMAPWGDNRSVSAKCRGAQGIVIDGATRDAQQICELGGFACFTLFLTPVGSGGEARFKIEALQVPVNMHGQLIETVVVHPGDFIVGDRDGIVVVPQNILEEVLVAAERLEEIEKELRDGIVAGEDRETLYKRIPRFAHVRRAE